MSEPIRVLIADDHPLFRDGLIALLHDEPDTELTGTAATGTEAVDLARETQPDVVVMDLQMPGLNGIEATRRIVADSPHIAVLVLTMFDDDDSIFSALRAGARGYLLKGADREQIRCGIQAAANGEVIFGAQLAERITSSSLNALSSTTWTPGSRSRMRTIASRPSTRGIRTSSTAQSGTSSFASATAAHPSEASPMTSNRPSARSARTSPSRTSG